MFWLKQEFGTWVSTYGASFSPSQIPQMEDRRAFNNQIKWWKNLGCVSVYTIWKLLQWSKQSREWVKTVKMEKMGWKDDPGSYTCCPCSVIAASCALCLLPSWHYFSCVFFMFCPLSHARFRVWAQSLVITLVLVLGYNSHLPLSSRRQPNLTQPDPAPQMGVLEWTWEATISARIF